MAKHNSPQKHGSVGNSTFQGGPYGLIERQRVEPRNPRTLAQQTIRSMVKAFAGRWRELTELCKSHICHLVFACLVC